MIFRVAFLLAFTRWLDRLTADGTKNISAFILFILYLPAKLYCRVRRLIRDS